ncbi:hypothetical protein AAFH68_15980 [Flavobacterium sp. CGRL1]
MSRTRIVGGKIIKTSGGDYNMYAKDSIITTSAQSIREVGVENGVIYGEPESPKKQKVIESSFKFESSYIYDHLLDAAQEMIPKFNTDDTSIIYKFYKAIIEGKIVNLPIEVSANLISGKAFYDLDEKKIIVWENTLLGIEKNDNRKIKLLQDLTQSYSDYLNNCLQDISNQDGFEAYDYDMFRFDAMRSETIVIGKVETPTYKGSLELSFPETESEPVKNKQWRPETKKREHGPNAGNFDDFDQGPGDPPIITPNIGFKFSYSLKGGFTASLYAGVTKNVKAGDFGMMGAINTSLTYYGKGSVGTSGMSPNLVTLGVTPSITFGYKTGNSLVTNLFNNASGSGIWNPYEYAFTLGATGILSSGKVSPEFNPETEVFEKNRYNSHDISRDSNDTQDKRAHQDHTRNQIVGGAAIKVGNFMIASYNDIYKPPLFIGMGSDQYWSAGINMQAKLPNSIHAAYAVDMYYGKSNNKNPLNQDKMIGNQNYDYQQLFDVLLNRGQETFSLTNSYGNLTTETRHGFGTFWPTNAMHDSIAFPEKPKEPKKPLSSEFQNKNEYNEEKKKYDENLNKYKRDLINYNISIQLKSKPTFHHLYVVYDENNKVSLERLKKYLFAGQSEEGKLLKEFYLLEEKSK